MLHPEGRQVRWSLVLYHFRNYLQGNL
jgi:hypothetical protein